jgi:transposase InsO family protein
MDTPTNNYQRVGAISNAHAGRDFEEAAHLYFARTGTFGNILSRAGLTSPQKKRKRTTPCSEPFSLVTGPNQLWCMDFKGYFATGDGKRCDPFTITDAHSRYLIRCQIVSRMDLSQVRAICEAAMREYGMPARIRTDNGAPFAGTGLLGLSKLSLGWMKLGSCTSAFKQVGRNKTAATNGCIAL